MPTSSVARSVTRADRLAEYGIPASSIKAVSISLKPAPRERVPVRSQFDTRALSGASSTGNLPEPGTKEAGGKVIIAHAARPETDRHISRRGKLQRCAVNANADALIREAKEGRIGAEAYAAGFALQGLLERANGLTGPSNREWLAPQGGNKCRGQANAVLKMIETASVLEEQFKLINAIVGMTGMRILTLCLIGRGDGDGPKTFSEVAEMLGMARDWRARPARSNSQTADERLDMAYERRDRANDNDSSCDPQYAKRLKNEGIKVGWAFRNALDLLASHWQMGDAPKLRGFSWRG